MKDLSNWQLDRHALRATRLRRKQDRVRERGAAGCSRRKPVRDGGRGGGGRQWIYGTSKACTGIVKGHMQQTASNGRRRRCQGEWAGRQCVG